MTHQADLRISSLAIRFRQIGDEQMRELPFYNANLEVEAWDFSAFDPDHLIGVLITPWRSEEHTSELQSLMRISYAVVCLKKIKTIKYPLYTPTSIILV